MRTRATDNLIEHLCQAVSPPEGGTFGDAALLGRFIERHDEAAFAVLLHRHGPMVWGVCRRLLHRQDAEDAFQATFLVLTRKAASIRSKELVGNWLYGVAHQTALQARRAAARRRAKEVQVTNMPEIEAAEPDTWAEVQPLLDEELSRLPEIYRAVIVLCDLEGRTRSEIASQLGLPEGTVAGRLTRARSMLARRLTQRGIALQSGALAMLLGQQAASAGAPKSVVVSTIKAAGLLAAGKTAATGVVSVTVADLSEGVMMAMLFNKLKSAVALVLILGFMATGATFLSYRTAAGLDDKVTAQKPAEPAAETDGDEEAFTAWGKELNGLQAGLSILDRNNVKIGGKATAVARLRNLSDKPITVTFRSDGGPHVVNELGKPVHATLSPVPSFEIIPWKITVEAGRTIRIWKGDIFVLEVGAKVPDGPEVPLNQHTIYVPPGTYKAGFEGFLKEYPALSTGTVEFKVKDKDDPPAQNKKAPLEETRLTVDQAKKLLPQAAGISNADFKALQDDPRSESVKSKSLSLVLLSLKPPMEKNTDAYREFQILGENIRVSDITDAMWISKDKGYASFIQPKYITDCTCKSTAERAEGVVTFKSDLFSGSIPFVAQMTKEGWVITEFRLPHYMTKVVRGKDGIWVQEALKVAAAGDETNPRKEKLTAWGKEVGGLQAGLGYAAGQQRTYAPGETVKLVVRVRNVGKEEIKFRYCKETYFETPPTVTDGEGKPVELKRRVATGFAAMLDVKLAPGKEIELAEVKLDPRTATQSVHEGQWNLFTTGKFSIWYDKLEDPANDEALSKLGTGKLELEVKEADGFTAWGKEINGLQAGLSLSGEKRAYRHGETVTMVLRVRNVGKEKVKFSYLLPFIEQSLTVTDGNGKPVPQPKVIPDIGEHDAGVQELAPGKELVLHEWKCQIKPAGESNNKGRPYALYGTGKVSVQYDRVFGPPEMSLPNWKLDPALSKLASGKLELEVKETE